MWRNDVGERQEGKEEAGEGRFQERNHCLGSLSALNQLLLQARQNWWLYPFKGSDSWRAESCYGLVMSSFPTIGAPAEKLSDQWLIRAIPAVDCQVRYSHGCDEIAVGERSAEVPPKLAGTLEHSWRIFSGLMMP
jgi:hypothetical protein